MKIMVVGSKGQLGQKVSQTLKREITGQIISVSKMGIENGDETTNFDTLDRKAWKNIVLSDEWKPDVIINCAAVTNVDLCESERELAWKTNVHLVEMLSELCRKIDGKLIQFSTDYIFDGKNGPYDEWAKPSPVNYYGRTKLAAENVCKNSRIQYSVIRTMWMYSDLTSTKLSFVEWLISQLSMNKSMSIVNDEIGNPTLSDDVARSVVKVIDSDYNGVLNIAGADLISRMEWAKKVAQCFGYDPEQVRGVSSNSLGRQAVRPLNSGLITLKAQTILGERFTNTDEGLQIYKTLKERTVSTRNGRKIERK